MDTSNLDRSQFGCVLEKPISANELVDAVHTCLNSVEAVMLIQGTETPAANRNGRGIRHIVLWAAVVLGLAFWIAAVRYLAGFLD